MRRVGGRRGTLRGGVPGGRARSQRERPHPLFRRVVPLGAAFPKHGCRVDAVRGSSDATRRGASPRSASRCVRLRPWKRLDAGCVPERVSVACHRAAREHVWRLGSFVGRDVRFSRAGARPTSCFLEIFRSKSSHPVSRAKNSRSAEAVVPKHDRSAAQRRTGPRGVRSQAFGVRLPAETSGFDKAPHAIPDRAPAPARGCHAPWVRRAARASQSRRSPRRPRRRASPPPARRTPPRWRARRKNVP